jgi:LysM repeat protein
VEKGDTWWGIAEEHGLSVPELLALNDAAVGDILDIGDRINVAPDPDPVPGTPVPDGQGGGSTIASLIAALFRAIFRRT